jgi:LruC domain-containing protein
MPDKRGSELAYPGFYGLANDTSDPSKLRYYKTKNNLPWAIEIPTVFNFPSERQAITEKYPRFASWAQSGGELDKDWYMD